MQQGNITEALAFDYERITIQEIGKGVTEAQRRILKQLGGVNVASWEVPAVEMRGGSVIVQIRANITREGEDAACSRR